MFFRQPIFHVPSVVVGLRFDSTYHKIDFYEDMVVFIQAYLPEGALTFGYHSIYSTPWAPSAKIEEEHYQLTKVTKLKGRNTLRIVLLSFSISTRISKRP
jgi:hypothetical protein